MMKMKGVENKAMAPKGQTKIGKPAKAATPPPQVMPGVKGGKKGKGC